LYSLLFMAVHECAYLKAAPPTRHEETIDLKRLFSQPTDVNRFALRL